MVELEQFKSDDQLLLSTPSVEAVTHESMIKVRSPYTIHASTDQPIDTADLFSFQVTHRYRSLGLSSFGGDYSNEKYKDGEKQSYLSFSGFETKLFRIKKW